MCDVARRYQLPEIHAFIQKSGDKIASWLPAAVHASIADLERVVTESVTAPARPYRGPQRGRRAQAPTWQNKDWENFRTFKATKVLSSDTPVSQFRTIFNKMTDKAMAGTVTQLGELLTTVDDRDSVCMDLAEVVLVGTAASPGNADLYARFLGACQAPHGHSEEMTRAVMDKLRALCTKQTAKVEFPKDDSYDALCTANAANDRGTAYLRLAVLSERYGVLSPGSTSLLTKRVATRLAKLGKLATEKPEAEVLVARLVSALEATGAPPSAGVRAAIDAVLSNCEKRSENPGMGNKVRFTLLDYYDTLGA